MFEIVRYTAEKADEWNAFVAESKNGTFLFNRGYMDYHADRFVDHSLMFYVVIACWQFCRFCLPMSLAIHSALTTA